MTYLYPNGTVGLSDLAVWTNSVTNSLFWPLTLFGLFCILFFSFKQYPTERAFAASSFITMIIAILMGIVGLVSPYIYVGAMILAGIGLVALRSSNNKEF